MKVELSIVKENEEVIKYFLHKENTSIGRSSQNDICLPDPSISRTHFVIVRKGENYIATDKSTNGTFINEERITSRELKLNDVIKIGHWIIHFRPAGEQFDNLTTQVSEIRRDVSSLVPTKVLSYRPEKNELICEKAMLDVLGPAKKTFTVSKPIMSMGKANANEIVLKDEYTSNFHCKIENREGRYVLKDLKSTNGTLLNGQKIIEAPLPFDSIIEIGRMKLRFYSAEETEILKPSRSNEFEGIRSVHPKMRELFALIPRVAPSDATLLIQGETGTGKELVARAFHNQSGRKKRAFVAINCGAISKDLMESELFGHEKGAFTSAHQQRRGAFEQASGGTLFLDEIGELSLDLQPKLLRALETKEIRRVGGAQTIDVDVRIIAATNLNLAEEVQKGRFRKDLFYRLHVVPIFLPPLRERPEDIPLLVDYFLHHEFVSKGVVKGIERDALERLLDHPWPGNVRELKNVLSRAVLDCQGPSISEADLQFAPVGMTDRTAYEYDALASTSRPVAKTLKDIEKEKILAELKRNNWNKKATAKVLGIAKSTLHEKIKKYGITEE